MHRGKHSREAGTALLSTLAALERARRSREALGLIVAAAGRALVVGSVLAVAAGLTHPPSAARWALLAIGFVPFVPVLNSVHALARRSELAIAAGVEERVSEVRGRLRPAVDLAIYLPPGTSADLAEMAQEQALTCLHRTDVRAAATYATPLPWKMLWLGVVCASFAAVSSGGRPLAWLGAAFPWLDPPPPVPWIAEVAPQDTSIAAGAAIVVRATVFHLPASGARVKVRCPGEMDASVPLFPASRHGPSVALAARLESPGRDYRYRIEVGDTTTPWFSVSEYQALRATYGRVVCHPPAYASRDSSVYEGLPTRISGLRGSEVDVTLRFNNDLVGCVATWQDSPCTMAVAAGEARARFTLRQQSLAVVTASDVHGQRASLGPLPLDVIDDVAPTIEWVVPGCDTILPRDLVVPVALAAHDDFGLSRALIRHVWAEREDTLVLARGRLGSSGSWSRQWDLSSLDLLPDDVVTYRFEVWDNDQVSGAKAATTRWFSLRFPTLEEIVASVSEEGGGIVDSLEAISGEGSELQDELKELAAELVGAESVEWGTREDLRELAARQHALGERLAQVADELAKLERTATEEDLFTARLLDKVAAVQDLLQSLRLPQLERALEELQRAVDTVSPQELEQALTRLQAHQQEILESLDRAIEMLRRLEVAQRLSSLTRVAERIQADQESLLATSLSPQQADEESRIVDAARRLEEGLDALQNDMRPIAPPVADLVAQGLDRFRESQTPRMLEQASSAMRTGSPEARSLASSALTGLQQLSADLQAAEAAMDGADMSQTLEELARAERTVSELAIEQKALCGQGDASAARQRGLAEALRSLREQLERTLSTELGPAVSSLLGTMARAQNELDGAVVAGHKGAKAASALRALNTVSGALSALRQDLQASCSGGAGMEDLFGLSQSQGRLNRSCQSLLPRAGGLSREVLSSLAARQQMIRDRLSQIASRAETHGSVVGELGSIGEEMEEVVAQLEREGLGEEAVRRQQRILSRLLDAQRSVRRQGVARRRMSEPARRQIPASAEPLPAAGSVPAMAPPPRRDDVYPPAYREAIEAYFRALSSPHP